MEILCNAVRIVECYAHLDRNLDYFIGECNRI